MPEAITIELDPREMRVVNSSLNEYGGGSARTLSLISGHSRGLVSTIKNEVQAQQSSGSSSLSLMEEHWRAIYDSVNATLYALGPFELETCTGCGPIDFLQTNLTIASHVWGAYGKARWCDYYQTVRK